jgi:L-ribulose-5-phosphate 4-epimerase
MSYTAIREQVYQTVLKSVNAGLIRLSVGNISVRAQEGLVAITPRGIPYDVLRPEEIAIVDLEGRPVDAPKKPSSETPMHTAIYHDLPEVGAILHTHSLYAITFATLGKDIPIVTIELFVCGAPIPVAPWACPGTPEAGKVTVKLFRERPGLKICLLRNHGLVSIGENLDKAFEYAVAAETGMQAYHHALQIGQPELITEDRIAEIIRVYA